MRPPDPCVPRSKCWCEQHPNSKLCQEALTIDNNVFLILIILLIFTYIIKRKIIK